jgi:two-component system, OmpR family, phosphate regulon sensor histidine kinase PhoR
MSRRILWILTVALSLALLGLIFIQVSWIKSAVELKDTQFQQLVNNTLTDVSRQLDQYYISRRMNAIIEERLSSDPDDNWLSDPDLQDPAVDLNDGGERSDNYGIIEGDLRQNLAEIIGDSVIVITHHGGSAADTINISGYRDEESRRRLAESLNHQQVMMTTIMKRLLLENVSFEKRIDQQHLEKILSRYLIDRGINLDYEYVVLRDNRKEIYASDGFSRETDCHYFRTLLLNDEILQEETYLYLYFPGQGEFVRSSLGFLVFSTLFLTILMILLFTFALYVIFRQKKLSDIKNDFVNNMTHELKTPISTISLASQMLNDESISAERKNSGHISRIIQAESKRLGYQVERVLQMAVLDQGHLVLKRKEVSMNEIIHTVVQNFKLQVENRNGKIELIDESTNDVVHGDKVHLVNVVTNLLDNAVKYSRETPEITVYASNTVKQFRLSVRDRGIGISKDNQKKVFDRFYRVSTGNVHDVKGFGLGLSYVKLIVEQHSGSITLSSELNKGTQFDIILPLQTEMQPS